MSELETQETQPSVTFEGEVKHPNPNPQVTIIPSVQNGSQSKDVLPSSEEKKLLWEKLDQKSALKLKLFCKSAKNSEKGAIEWLITSTFNKLKAEKLAPEEDSKDISSVAKEKLERISTILKLSPEDVLKSMLDKNVSDKTVEHFLKHNKA